MKKSSKSKEDANKKSPTSKSHTSRASSNIYMATEQMYQIALKSMVSSVVPHCPKEILVEISKFLNMIYPKIKDHCLNTVMLNDTVKRRELAWENVNNNIQDVLLPLLQAVNTEQKPLIQVPDEKEVDLADSTKIKEINTTSSSRSENHSGSARLEHAIKAYASTQKKIVKYIGPSL
jgi:hypothetical protein